MKKFFKNSSLVTNTFNRLNINTIECDELKIHSSRVMSGKFVSSRLILLIIRKIHADVTSDELKQKLFYMSITST